MPALPAWSLIVLGAAIGFACGYTTRRARLCSFGAIEDAWMAGDTSRLRVFGLALATALTVTQILIVTGLLDFSATAYLPTALPWLSILIGSTLFGLGMALVGTCGYGLLIRLGSGDLRCLVVLLVFGAVGYATLRGILSGLRIDVLESAAWPMAGGQRSDLASLTGWYLGGDVRPIVTVGFVGLLLTAVVADPRLRRSPRLLTAGLVLGIGVALGWIFTAVLVDEFDMAARPQSLTFVAPVAKALYAVFFNPQGFLDFGVGSVFGVVLGAFANAQVMREFRWEAFDDDREMRRHLAGAALMGFGGITAGGCTIGQGVTAGSLMSMSWPLAVLGMMLGARLGIQVLVEGSLREWLKGGMRKRRSPGS